MGKEGEKSRRPEELIEICNGPGVVAHAFNLSTREAEADRFLSLRPDWSTE
jgi:3-methyladenine DNA glycosylase Mpg